MKTTKTTQRLIMAFISSLLFALGLTRAATHFEPISRSVSGANQDVRLTPGENCGSSLSLVIDDVK